MKWDLRFVNECSSREALTIAGPRCVAEWHAGKLRRQRVARTILLTAHIEQGAT